MFIKTSKLALAVLCTASINAQAIVVRHDRSADKYLATKTDFPPLVTFYTIGVHGTLIAPQWILTAAHTVFCFNEGQYIEVGEEFVQVGAKYSYPTCELGGKNDLALIS